MNKEAFQKIQSLTMSAFTTEGAMKDEKVVRLILQEIFTVANDALGE